MVGGEFEGEAELSDRRLKSGRELLLAFAEEAGAEGVDGFDFAAAGGKRGEDRVAKEAGLPPGEVETEEAGWSGE